MSSGPSSRSCCGWAAPWPPSSSSIVVWPAANRRDHNEIIGWQLSVIGTTYAVILAFMLFNVWDNFRTADINADQQANALVNLYRLAQGLPDATRAQIQLDARRYAQIMIEEEWPDMAHRTVSSAGTALTQEPWESVVTAGKDPAVQGPDFTQGLTEPSNMTQHRRVRHLESEFRRPGLLWTVLLAGGIVTIISSCLLSAEKSQPNCLPVGLYPKQTSKRVPRCRF